ncbi:major facilitator superfamily domain-containing protein [Kockovaella imperatae]|uniref:Major facilitator superfamily domain-containing protein n=1 Tax=Kockovaella imperatae TaxID=4999 RepID=A0A1Y1UB74_9TREE|nr:major facilitator superfamily domain-containing protein [Kockovaella imperatae]ORX35290.1 major facilitator superfamily domain-containing protein [Kockovaella imperatae]
MSGDQPVPRATMRAQLRFVAIAGVGLFLDGYLNIVIGLVVPMLGYIYFPPHGSVPAIKGDEMKGGLSVGMVIGQLGFGLFGDALGRHKVYGKELLFTIVGTLLVVLVPWKGISQEGVVAWITCFRVLTGFGIGGDYPMSSSLAAEKTIFGSRAKLILTVFACIGCGGISASIVNTILLRAGRQSIEENIDHLQWVWRILLGVGIVPALLTLYARLTMRESGPYEKYVATETGLRGPNKRGLKEQFEDFRVYFRQPKHARVLFAVSAVWFLFDIAFYGVNYNQSIILKQIGYGKGKTPYETLWHTAIGNIIVQSAGYLPGFFIGIFLPDWIGRRAQQFWLCLASSLLYAIWAGVSTRKKTPVGGLMTLFTLAQLVLNAGPNCTTFLIPVEVFPTRVRGSAHGIAAASGKVGAILTAFAFGTVVDHIGLPGTLGLFAGIMALAAGITLMIPETKGTTIEDIENDKIFGGSSVFQDDSINSTPDSLMKGTNPPAETMRDFDDKRML